MTPVLQLQDRCDEAERERKKLQLVLIDRTRHWQWKVTPAEKAMEENNEKLRRMWRKTSERNDRRAWRLRLKPPLGSRGFYLQ